MTGGDVRSPKERCVTVLLLTTQDYNDDATTLSEDISPDTATVKVADALLSRSEHTYLLEPKNSSSNLNLAIL